MNALDVAARGLAKRALDAEAETNEGAANIDVRGEPTAAALEALSAEYPALLGVAGESHTVETAPYLSRQRLVIRGNGAELRNVNATPLSTTDAPSGALPVGVSNVWGTEWLTYYSILSANGTVLSVAAGDGDNFAVGDLVVVHGVTSYFVSNGEYHVYRNYTRARVIAATTSSVTLDRILPLELLADSPVIANANEGVSAAIAGLPNYYLLYAPHVSNLTLASDLGETLKWGGVIDGTFRDLIMIGRNGVVLNAMQDCLIENVCFHGWRKICEIAEGSVGTTVRNLRGTLADASTKFAGASDVAPFFIGIAENSAHCVFEGFDVSSGPNDASGGVACQMTAGRNNEIRNSRFRFPAHTGNGLSLSSHAENGNGNVDCGYRNVEVHLPVGNRFFGINDLGAGIVRPHFIDCKFFGSVAVNAGQIAGDQGVLRNVWCEDGGLEFLPGCTNWQITGCYFPAGFINLTQALFQANPGIHDNESDSSRRLSAASVIGQFGATWTVTATAANSPFQSATFAPGDLQPGDVITMYALAYTGNGSGTNRKVRPSVTSNGATIGMGGAVAQSDGSPMDVDGELTVLNNSQIVYRINVAGTTAEQLLTGLDLDTHGLTVNLEYWVDSPSEPINVKKCHIVARKPGMRHPPLK